MGPVRGNKKKKRKAEKKAENNSLLSGSSEEGSAEWWDVLSKKIVGNPSSANGLDQFKYNFQMSRKTFDYICSLVKDHMMVKTHFAFTNGSRMSVSEQVALALRRLGSGNSLITIGDSFGTHHSTVSQVTWRFVEALEEKAVHHIQWPSTEQEMTEIKNKFEKIRGLPNCCGAIDNTHIKMQLTSSNPEADTWLDPSKHYSMVLQAVVDPDLRFLNIVTGLPGKMSDSSILQSSNFFKLCQEGEILNCCIEGSSSRKTELREYVIGDSGYPLLPWLITPYKGKKLSETKMEFNTRLLATHAVAQRALTRLKETWRIIQGDMWRPDKHRLPSIILACCILHNIIIETEDEISYETNTSENHDSGYMAEVCTSVDKAGSYLRDRLSAYFSGR